MSSDADLLRRYADYADQGAFRELVEQHLGLVYAAALRQVNGDAHLAQDVAQGVFTDLARKSSSLTDRPVLAGWLYTATAYAAAKAVRTEQRRRNREQEAHAMQQIDADPTTPPDATSLRPVLDAAMLELTAADREAVLLRYFEGRDYATIGARLNLTENAARMRVDRALGKLHGGLTRRGIQSTAAALGVALAGSALAATPPGLAATVATSALAGAAAVGGGATLLTFMSTVKFQLGLGAALVGAGALTLAVQQQANARLQDELAVLRTQTADLPALRTASQQLSAQAAETDRLRREAAQLDAVRTETKRLYDQYQQNVKTAPADTKAPSATKPLRGQVYDIGQLDRPPQLTLPTAPVYPHELIAYGITGDVTVEFVIATDGAVQEAKIVTASNSQFEEPALTAIRTWKFNPGQKGGTPVNVRVQQKIMFSMESHNPRWFF